MKDSVDPIYTQFASRDLFIERGLFGTMSQERLLVSATKQAQSIRDRKCRRVYFGYNRNRRKVFFSFFRRPQWEWAHKITSVIVSSSLGYKHCLSFGVFVFACTLRMWVRGRGGLLRKEERKKNTKQKRDEKKKWKDKDKDKDRDKDKDKGEKEDWKKKPKKIRQPH